jgi:hypothetical protein
MKNLLNLLKISLGVLFLNQIYLVRKKNNKNVNKILSISKNEKIRK